MCQLQLNVFFEFKKKVFTNHAKFTAILQKSKFSKPGPLSKKVPPKTLIGTTIASQKRHTRATVKIEKVSNAIETVELPVPPHLAEALDTSSPKKSKRPADCDSDETAIKFIKLEADDGDFFAEDDETEQYLEEQYLDSEVDETGEDVEYVYEDDADDENRNSFKEEYLKIEGADTSGEGSAKKMRKPKTPKVKKFATERVLDADTMNEYDAVKCLNCSEYFETMDKFTAHQ